MNWKEFLKPNWKKIILMLVIFFISIFIPIIPELAFMFGCPIGMQCPGSYVVYTNFYSKFLTQLNFMIQYGSRCESCPRWTDFFSFLIIYLIISYILSCLIVWIYDKVRKKKK